MSEVSSDLRRTLDGINQPSTQPAKSQASTLGQDDFLRLLTTQLSQQDPLEPVENTDMLAQMAQFSSLANTAATNDTLKEIVARLDELIDAQTPADES